MYGFLTIEDAQKLIESGFCIILDDAKKETIIKNEELDYTKYKLSKIKYQLKNTFEEVYQTVSNVFKVIVDAISPIIKPIIETIKEITKDDKITGIDLLISIENNKWKKKSKFILKNKESKFNDMIVCLEDNLLYFELFNERTPLDSSEIINSKFHIYIDKENLYKKAINRLKVLKKIKSADDTYDAIVYLEQEIDDYRNKIQKLEGYIKEKGV